MSIEETIETNNRIFELTGCIRANEFIIKTAKCQIDWCEKEIAILCDNTKKVE